MDVDILGADGESIGKLPLAEARAKKLIYRVAGVIVTNSKGEILVHQRSMAQEHYGGKWAIMACAPVPVGDTYVPTAAKVVREQLRVVPPKGSIILHPIFPYKLRSADANIDFGIFRCLFDGNLTPNPVDIGTHFFASVSEIEKLMQEKPFLQSSREILKKYLAFSN